MDTVESCLCDSFRKATVRAFFFLCKSFSSHAAYPRLQQSRQPCDDLEKGTGVWSGASNDGKQISSAVGGDRYAQAEGSRSVYDSNSVRRVEKEKLSITQLGV